MVEFERVPRGRARGPRGGAEVAEGGVDAPRRGADGPPSAARPGGAFVVDGPIHHHDIVGLCRRLARVITDTDDPVEAEAEADTDTDAEHPVEAGDQDDAGPVVKVEAIVCDLTSAVTPTDATVEVLARLQLTARRLDRRLQLGRCSPAVRGLLDRIGFSEILPDVPGDA